ncbi:conserved unknown protein [Ectocarpus siliculosus]|uniref:Suppressor of forked domain-containing protein n=1 Tax=Ectocarpus siliculosus TaxID=2880 RepID=D8LR95_ECTSI|nr:conserved unknown protein [Ectocarpus siliculosus]|eukprot:CBN75000.1 conserved unknown protein [Ectocarpus siliculosus]
MTDSPFQAPALQVLWQAVTFDPMDFQCWTALLSQVESVGSSADAHRAYDEFLRQFPLCFGYWKKYANLARKHPAPPTSAAASTSTGGAAEHTNPSTTSRGGHEERGGVDGGAGGGSESLSPEARRAHGVYERAVSAAPFCLELWEAFVGDVMGEGGGVGEEIGVGKGGGGGGRAADVRRVFERALEAVGDNPGAGPLWRTCVAFEEAQGGRRGPLRVTRLYERAFGHRLKDLEVLWIGFKEFVDGLPWGKLRPSPPPPPPPSATSNATGEGEATAVATAAAAEGDDAVDDDDFEVAEAALVVASSAEEGSTDADKKAMLVRTLGEKRKASLRGRQRRESFERRISRPHFHVKPLDDAQLLAWSQYLDFEQAQAAGAERGRGEGLSSAVATPGRKRRRGGGEGENGDGGSGSNRGRGSRGSGDVERLFERCLVPCASYSWLWERYALWKESVRGLESALEVAERACSPFLRWRPEALFFKAELLERVGRKEEARNVYQHVLSEVAPGLVEGACKLACFERRCGNREAASAAYRSLLPPPLGLPAGGGGGGEKGGKSSHWEETTETTRPYLYMQLARFQQRVLGNPGSARATFRAAVGDIPGSRELWLAFLEFEAAQPQALHAGRVEAAFRMAIGDGGGGTGAGGAKNTSGEENDDGDARRLTVEDRADLWEWFEEFVEDLCMDVAKVMSVRAEHRAWTRAHGTGAHEAAAATAAAGQEASAASGSAVGPPQASRSSDRGNANDNGNGSTGPATCTGAAPANPHRPGNATAGGGTRGYAGNPGVSLDAASAGGAMIGVTGDQQRRNEWSAYYQQQQQQQQHVMGVSDPPSTEAAPSGGAAHPATFGQGPSSWSPAMMEPAAAGAWGALPANPGLPNFVPGTEPASDAPRREPPPPPPTAAARPARVERLG